MVQFVLANRIKWLEKGVGYDRMLRWHKFNGKLALVTVLVHPGLVFFGPLFQAGVSPSEFLEYFTFGYWYGEVAFLLMIVIVGTTLYAHKIKLDYERWRWVHRLVYVIIVLGFMHSFAIGSDVNLQYEGQLFWYWATLAAISLYAIFYRYIWRPLQFRKSRYVVDKIIQETKNVRSFYLKPKSGKRLDYAPGQFAFTKIYSDNLSNEEHHFTLSSSTNWDNSSFSIKESGDYTSELGKVKEGDEFHIEGPYGVCSNVGMRGPFVMIAGGIGITPIMSMLRSADRTFAGKVPKTLLVYANKTQADVAFKDELEQMAQDADWLDIAYVYSDDEVEGTHHGYVTKEVLEEEIKNSDFDISASSFFLVGPPPMMNAVEKALLSLGARKGHIFTERFALR